MPSPVIDDLTRQLIRLAHFVGLLLTVVCGTVAYELLYVPLQTELAEMRVKVGELQQLLRNGPAARQESRRLAESLAAVREEIADVTRRVPDEPDSDVFLKQIGEIAQQENFVLNNFRPGKIRNQDGFAEMEITLSGTGSYQSICTFFDRLARLQRLSKVRDLEIEVGETPNRYPTTATLVIYFDLREPMGEDQEVTRG